jgi:hypothetical protein
MKTRTRLAFTISLALGAAIGDAQVVRDWPVYGGDVRRSHASRATTLQGSLWRGRITPASRPSICPDSLPSR